MTAEENDQRITAEDENTMIAENGIPPAAEDGESPVLADADGAEDLPADEPPAEEASGIVPGGTPEEETAEGPGSAAPEAEESRADDVLSVVRAENERLRAELETARAAADRLADGYAELGELFPGADLRAMPDSFREAVKNGVPPAAAYALEVRRREVERSRAEEAARLAHDASAGRIVGSAPSLYSPDEVRAMSPAEVRENYSLILDSMRRW